jgi:hypothetical protein
MLSVNDGFGRMLNNIIADCITLSIKIDLREIGWDGMDWIDPAQDRDQGRAHVNNVMNLRVP